MKCEIGELESANTKMHSTVVNLLETEKALKSALALEQGLNQKLEAKMQQQHDTAQQEIQ
jgi:hypothetical protein